MYVTADRLSRSFTAKPGFRNVKQRSYLVHEAADDAVDADIIECDGLPVLGENYADPDDADNVLVCGGLAGRPLEKTPAGWLWKVDANFETHPCYLPVKVNAYTSHKMEPQHFDLDGELIVNSARDMYDPTPEEDLPLTRLEIVNRWQYSEWDPDAIESYARRKNSLGLALAFRDPSGRKRGYGTYPAGTIFMSDLRATMADDPVQHVVVSYCLEIDPEGWTVILPDLGPRCYDKKDDTLGPYRGDHGVLYGGKVLLDGDGYAADVQNPGEGGITVVTKEFNLIDEADFRDLKMFSWGSDRYPDGKYPPIPWPKAKDVK